MLSHVTDLCCGCVAPTHLKPPGNHAFIPAASLLRPWQHAAPAAGAGGGRKQRGGWPLSLGDFLPSGSGAGGGTSSSGSPLGGVAGQVESALVALGVLSPSSREVDPWEPFLGKRL
jgi:hypothetical protein